MASGSCLRCGGVVPIRTPPVRGTKPRFCSDECRAVYRREYTQRWGQANRASVARRRDAIRDQVRAWNREFYARNRERRKAFRLECYRKNKPAALAASRAYNKQHSDIVRAIGRRSRAARRARLLEAFVESVDSAVVFARDGGICGICKTAIVTATWEIDHIVPLSRGGQHSYANVQVAHRCCNRAKGNNIPYALDHGHSPPATRV